MVVLTEQHNASKTILRQGRVCHWTNWRHCRTVRTDRCHLIVRSETQSSERRAVLLGTLALVTQIAKPTFAEDNAEVPLRSHISKTLSAPRQFLLQRLRANGGAKILAPVRASKQRLEEAEKILHTINVYDPNPKAYSEMLQLIRASSLNCYAFDVLGTDSIETRASSFQRRIGFGDACTYRLIAKNVTNLLTQARQKLKVATFKSLDELINSYHLLDDMVDRAIDSDPMAIERIPDVLQFTLAHVSSFESLIERCLELPVSNVAPTPGDDSDDTDEALTQ